MSQLPFSEDRDSIFAAMRQQIASTPLPDQKTSLIGRVRSRTGVALSTGLALLAVLAVILTTGVLTSPPPAFAVTVRGGTVVIRLSDIRALGALNARLASTHIPIRVVPVRAGCKATVTPVGPHGTTLARQTLLAGSASVPLGTLSVKLAQRIPTGETIVVGFSPNGRRVMFPHAIAGPTPRCVGVGTRLGLIFAHH